MTMFMTVAFRVFGSILMACIFLPFTIIIVIILFVVIVLLSRNYMKCTTELRRLNQLSSSPIISNVSETITGLTSISAFGIEGFMKKQFGERVELNNKAYMHESMVLRYMNFWVDM